MKRRSGVLIAVSSLPSDYGIGDLGLGAYRFVDRIAEMGFSLWQVLPLNCPDMYGSPYTSISAFAASPLYISPDLLVEEGLISAQDAESAKYGGPFYSRPTDMSSYWYGYNGCYEGIDENGWYHCENTGKNFWFNTPDVIAQKTQYAIDNGYGGVMIWHYNCDLPSYAEGSLLGAIGKTVENNYS